MTSESPLNVVFRQVAVQLCAKQAVSSVTEALAVHSLTNAMSPAVRMLLPSETSVPQDSTEELLASVLYSVEGVFSDDGRSKLFVLDDTTVAQHRTHASLRRSMRYAVLISRPSSSCGQGSHVPNVELAAVVDCSPSSAVMQHYKGGVTIATRQSSLMSHASDVIASIERGTVGCDVDSALSNCCLWLVESLQIAEQDFRRALQKATESSSALGIVEAFQKRYSSTSTVQDVLTAPRSVAARLEGHAEHSGQGYQRWMQRKAQLALLAEQRRLEATWLAMLAHPLLTLQLVQTRASQSLQPLVDLVPRLTILLQLISFAYPCQSITGEATSDRLLILDGEYSESFLHCIRHRLTPQIAKTLVAKCSELIGFPTLFSVSAVADRDELQGYVMPLCTREAIQAGLKNCSDLLLYFSTVFRSISFGFNKSFPRTAAAASPLIPLSGDTDVATQGPIYAAHRIGDLLRFVQQVDTAGSGMISQEVLCLYQTLHRGATSFDLLAVDEYKNWQIFADNFDKTLVLKFVTEEPVKYSAPAIPVAAPAPPAPAAAASSTPTLSSESGVTQRVVADEERAILSSRVTVLTAELAECRQLLAIMTKELDQSQRAVKEAQELNLTLLMEMQRSNIMRSVGEVGATDLPTRYQALVEAIASDGQQ